MLSKLHHGDVDALREAARIGLFSPELIGKRVTVYGELSVAHWLMEVIVKSNGGLWYDAPRDGIDLVIASHDVIGTPKFRKDVLMLMPGAEIVTEEEFVELLRRKDDL